VIKAALLKAAAATGVVALATTPVAVGMEMGDSAPGPHVSILFGSVTPVQVDVVAGETVHWSNDSVRDHTVTADDGSYDSGDLAANQHYDRVFGADGSYTYHCRLHPYIRGEIDVHTLLLDRPTQPGAPGRPYPLAGRAALTAGTAVGIQFDDGSGSWQEMAQATVGADGTFSARVEPTASGSYRAVAGRDASPSVDLLVLNRTVTASSRAVRGGSRVSVAVSPASPGATVVLQLHLKERFGWWPVAQHRLGKNSRTSFSLRHRQAVSARVVLTLGDGATAIGSSPALRLPRT
jgi:plastocyanin